MKTIMLATDFSENSRDAARYGYELARHLRTNVLLCNAVIVPAEVPLAGSVIVQGCEYDMLLEGSVAELDRFKEELERNVPAGGFKPAIRRVSQAGCVTDVIELHTACKDAGLVVTGVHEGGQLSSILTGNHVNQLIDETDTPLLVIPPGTEYQPLRKIAFATEFLNPEQDLKHIYSLITWARLLNAEILLVHVSAENAQCGKNLGDYLLDISNKANYPHIYYRLMKNDNVEDGLDWLCKHGHIDMLAMVHQPRNLLTRLFTRSHTSKMTANLRLPLLVFPA